MNERHSPIDPACTDHHGYEERKKYGCTGPDPGQYVYSGELMSKTKSVDHDNDLCGTGDHDCEAPAEASPKELRDALATARAVARSYEEENARLLVLRQAQRQIITGQRDEIETLTAENARLRAELERVRSLHVMRPGATVSAGDENARVCSDCEWYDTERVMWLNEAHGLMAVIERVRAVLDGDPGWSSEGLKGRLRSALLGAPDAGS